MLGAPTPESRKLALPKAETGWYGARYQVLADGALAVLRADADLAAAANSDRWQHAVGELARVAAAATARIDLISNNGMSGGPRFRLEYWYSCFDRFPDGRWLVADARTLGDPNARVLAPDGSEVRRIKVGDGINHLKIDSRSRVWVGWFDEGVFGNTEWRVDGLEWPPSAYGIAAFDEHGRVVDHSSLETIADCYALNVAGATAWSCTYTDFPIAHLGGDAGEQVWKTTLDGVSAIAIDSPNVLVAGGYGDAANRALLLRLAQNGAEVIGEWRLPFEVKAQRLAADFMDGRGDELHIVCDDVWHRWTVRDFLAGLPS